MTDEIYKRFDELRKKKGVTVYAVSKSTRITTTTFTNWKKGKYTPKQDKLQLIADYFGVSVDYLMTGKEPQFSVEMANVDAELIMLDKEFKEYAIKLSELPKDEYQCIATLIDLLRKE